MKQWVGTPVAVHAGNNARERLIGALAACAAVACAFSGCPIDDSHPPTAAAPADIAFVGGGVYTVDAEDRWASAVAVRDGVVAAVGSDADIRATVGPSTRVVDLNGHMLLPGFHDSHIHPVTSGNDTLECPLSGLPTIVAVLDKVRKCVASDIRRGDWLIGSGWNVALFPDGNASKQLLDEISADVPIALTDENGHALWLNTAALVRAGIGPQTQAPPAGVIERDPASGEASGTLRESAMDLVYRKLPPISDVQWLEAARVAVRKLHSVGVTSVIDAHVTEPVLRAYVVLADRGELNLRVMGCANESNDTVRTDALLARRDAFRRPQVNPDCVKLYADGVLEGETAALLDPYLDRPDYRGEPTYAASVLRELVTRYDAQGLQIHIHAIGTAAVREALDAIEAAREANGPRDRRPSIAHLQLVHPDDIGRFAALDVTANFQAIWAYPDEYVTELNLPVIGAERLGWMYPIGSVQRAGGRLVLGTDWNVTPPDALPGIETGLLRSDPSGEIEGVLNPEQRVDLATLIRAYTANGAWLMHNDREVGTIEVGKAADLVLLERNLFEIPPEEIGEVSVLETWVAGRSVYALADQEQR